MISSSLEASLPPRGETTRPLKHQIMVELTRWMEQHQLKQADAARILQVSRPRVSEMKHQKAANFTLDMLLTMLGRTGQSVQLTVVPGVTTRNSGAVDGKAAGDKAMDG